MFYAYIIKSVKNSTYYYGHTSNLEARVKQHNLGKTPYTKNLRPWALHYFESFATKSGAITREKFFKSIDGYNWLKSNNII
ncbi:MAG: GIY-YIG nuclease family protein [Bacteroidetes bacterium]|nr:GIY-YIG nuclease family protein [Bacteroidota bacterium]